MHGARPKPSTAQDPQNHTHTAVELYSKHAHTAHTQNEIHIPLYFLYARRSVWVIERYIYS